MKLSDYDIVITTYGIIRTEFKRFTSKKKSKRKTTNLFNYTWLRIICDEATAIHNFKTGNSKAILELKGICKWLLTGTPVQNTLDDLQSFAIYLKYQPWNNRTIWKRFISSELKYQKIKMNEEISTKENG